MHGSSGFLPGHAPGSARVRNLTRHFGGPAPVLASLDLDIRPGESVVLLGASGSGKTTLLRTLAGLDPVPDDAVVALPRPVAVAFQQPLLLPWTSVWRNVACLKPVRRGRGRVPRLRWPRSGFRIGWTPGRPRHRAARRNGRRWPGR